MSKKARLAKKARRKLKKIEQAIEEVCTKLYNRPKHILETIEVGFDPFMPEDKILKSRFTYGGRTLVILPESLKSKWEEMEEQEGIRAKRIGDNNFSDNEDRTDRRGWPREEKEVGSDDISQYRLVQDCPLP